MRPKNGQRKVRRLKLKALFDSRFQLENLLIQSPKAPDLIYISNWMQKIGVKGNKRRLNGV
jgi:hypothetical protein